MQSVEINGLDRVLKSLESTPQILREARGEVMDEMGQALLGNVQRRIGGSGRVAGVQEYPMLLKSSLSMSTISSSGI